MQIGDAVLVQVLRRNPEVNRLKLDSNPDLITWIFILATAACAYLGQRYVRRKDDCARNRAAVVERGVPALGLVIRFTEAEISDERGTLLHMTYRFEVDDVGPQTGRSLARRRAEYGPLGLGDEVRLIVEMSPPYRSVWTHDL
ncbi:MAG: hypothetical protein AAF330_00215 [Pseudomonadota bacterium]